MCPHFPFSITRTSHWPPLFRGPFSPLIPVVRLDLHSSGFSLHVTFSLFKLSFSCCSFGYPCILRRETIRSTAWIGDHIFILRVNMLPLEGRSQSIFIVTTVFLGISFIAVCLRCFVRLRLVKAFGWDDTFMVCAMVCMIVLMPKPQAWTNWFAAIKHLVRFMRYHWRILRNGTKIQWSREEGHDRNRNVCMLTFDSNLHLRDKNHMLKLPQSGGGSVKPAMSGPVRWPRSLSHSPSSAWRFPMPINSCYGLWLASLALLVLSSGSCWHCNVNRLSSSGNEFAFCRTLMPMFLAPAWTLTISLTWPMSTVSPLHCVIWPWVFCLLPWCGTCRWTYGPSVPWRAFWGWDACMSALWYPEIRLSTDVFWYSASAAVIVRIPFLHDYKDTDFLCECPFLWFIFTR